MKNIVVFASGRGSNFSAIAKAIKKGKLKASLSLLICDNPKAAVLERAERLGVKSLLIRRDEFATKENFETKIIGHLRKNKIDLVVLAGFMRILGPRLIKAYKNRIINIHPALLPAFKGAYAIRDAFAYGVKITGVTVHFVDEQMDSGPIILQKAVDIGERDTLETLETNIHKTEHQLYPKAIQLFLDGRLKIAGRKVIIR